VSRRPLDPERLAAIDEAVARWRQGDVFRGKTWVTSMADLGAPLTGESLSAERGEDDLVALPIIRAAGPGKVQAGSSPPAPAAERDRFLIPPLLRYPSELHREIEASRLRGECQAEMPQSMTRLEAARCLDDALT
jgi:hypothetical protein